MLEDEEADFLSIRADEVSRRQMMAELFRATFPFGSGADAVEAFLAEEAKCRQQLMNERWFELRELQRAHRKHRDRVGTGESRRRTPHSVGGDAGVLEDSSAVPSPVAVLEEESVLEHRPPPSTYRGFEVDPLGEFLLQYEADLRRFRRSVEMQRRKVASEHDRITEQRDRLAEEVVQGRVGASWVARKTLPLSDLLRGPNSERLQNQHV